MIRSLMAAPYRPGLIAPSFVAIHFVDQFHDSTDGRIEVESFADIVGYLLDGVVEPVCHALICIALYFIAVRHFAEVLREVVYHTIYSVDKPEASFYALVGPVQFSFRRSRKQNEQSCCICTVLLDDFLRADNIAQDLLILAPSLITMPCVSRILERFFRAYQSQIIKSAIWKNLAYIRWRIACSTPPMYWSTFIQ